MKVGILDLLTASVSPGRIEAVHNHRFKRYPRGLRMKAVQLLRTLSMADGGAKLRRMWRRLAADPELRAFHEGKCDTLPAFYRGEYRRRLGPYGDLMTEADMTPRLDQLDQLSQETPAPASLSFGPH